MQRNRMIALSLSYAMFEYPIRKIDNRYVVLADEQPQLTFDSLASAEAAIAEVAALASRPAIAWPERGETAAAIAC